MCGEKLGGLIGAIGGAGSPPRMRGKVPRAALRLREHRITPAHAGKSRASAHQASVRKDHPRMCGEKGFFTFVGTPM